MILQKQKAKQRLLAMLILQFLMTAIYAQDIIELTDSFEKFDANDTFEAEKYLIQGEPNYTIIVYKKGKSGRKIIQIARNFRDFYLCDSGKKLFLRTNSDSEGLPKFYFYNGLNGSINNLGRFAHIFISSDGNYILSYIPRSHGQRVGIAVLYSTINMAEQARFDFNSLIADRFQQKPLSADDYFELGYLYSDEAKGFEILFDHYGEVGPFTFTGLITVRDQKFRITDRKNELLKLLGYK